MPPSTVTLRSMTAFASRTGQWTRQWTGQGDPCRWTWDMRGVNARGLDIRLRLPEGHPFLDAALRAALGKRLHRGNVSVGLRLSRTGAFRPLAIDAGHLDRVLQAVQAVQERASALGITLAQPTAAEILGHRSVLTETDEADDEDTAKAALTDVLIGDFGGLLDDFCAMRAVEGATLGTVIAGQIDGIETLVDSADTAASDRRVQTRATLTAAIARVLEDADVPPDRLAQELALLAVKSDVTEEIDRLRGHIAAARDLLAAPGAQGRKLDFLAQEFNREANTLCSKAGAAPLTAVGLELKAAIEQMREQIQNVE